MEGEGLGAGGKQNLIDAEENNDRFPPRDEEQNNNQSDDEDDDSEEDEDDEDDQYDDSEIKDDILRPASTRSKIVVNLKEYGEKGAKKAFGRDDKIEYILDPYDKVRMKLIFENEKLYKAYENTINHLQTVPKYQPRKRQMPWYYEAPAIIIELVVLIIFFYLFFLIIQLALFNLVIVGIIFVFSKKIFQFAEAFRWKYKFNYKTKEFIAFIENQNDTVYKDMGIEVQYEREGCWLEFLLSEDELMFEEEIAKRREDIFKNKDTGAIEEMKRILNDYSKEKDLADSAERANIAN